MAKSKKKPAAGTRTAKAATKSATSTVGDNTVEQVTPEAAQSILPSEPTQVSEPTTVTPAESFDDPTPVSPISSDEHNGGNGNNGGSSTEPTIDQIRRRAYEIYLERSGAPGNPLEDWSRAERELRGW